MAFLKSWEIESLLVFNFPPHRFGIDDINYKCILVPRITQLKQLSIVLASCVGGEGINVETIRFRDPLTIDHSDISPSY